MITETNDRQGPRPLALHAFAAWRAYLLAATIPNAPKGSELESIVIKKLGHTPTERLALTAAVLSETCNRWSGFWSGVAKYRSHAFKRPSGDQQVVWQNGQTSILDFAPESKGPPIIAIPSLINNADVLDLLPRRSLMHALAEAGFRPFLVSWGNPETDAMDWPIDRYVEDRLIPSLNHIFQLTGKHPILMGYCMGGLLAAALASLRPNETKGLALLATPWNFHAPSPKVATSISDLSPWFAEASAKSGSVPTDIIQTLFIALDPTLAARKFRNFSELDQTSDEAQLFIAMEDWVNSGPDLAWPVAQTVLEDWYGSNLPHEGLWKVCGKVITPSSISGPILVASPSNDRIVPPTSSRAFAQSANNAKLLDVQAGHVGMIVGSRSKTELWSPLIEWLRLQTD
jgi:polyhydroxyalkanoate synthase